MSAGFDRGVSITVEPSVPTEADSIQVTVEWVKGKPCYEVISSHTLSDNVIYITVDAIPVGEVCIQVITPFTITEEIGRLPPGVYQAEVTLNSPCCFPCNPPPCIEVATSKVQAVTAPTPTPTSTWTPMATPTPTAQAALAGDVDCDGAISSINASLVLQFDAGFIGSLPCPESADVNEDGNTNAIDAALILQYDAGLIGSLPP